MRLPVVVCILALREAFPIEATVSTSTVPRFTIDLDLPPEDRWKEWVEHYRKMGFWDVFFSSNWTMARMNPRREEDWADALVEVLDEDYVREFKGLCKWIDHPKCTWRHLMHIQSIYEQQYPTFCSGMLVADEHGTVSHGRNMDYPMQFELRGKMTSWSELVSDNTFIRGGKPIFVSVGLSFGSTVHTAMRLDGPGWTFQQNTRMVNNTNAGNLAAIKQGALPYAYAMRKLMERVPDYETAVAEIQKINFAAPNYFMVAGPKPFQGTILAVSGSGRPDDALPPPLTLSPEKRILLQTNDDITGPPTDYRRPFAQLRLSYAPPDAGVDFVRQQMLTKPLLNSKTVFTWVACVANQYEETYNPWDDHKKVPTTGRLGPNFMQVWTKAAMEAEKSMAHCFWHDAWAPCFDQLMQALGMVGPLPPPGTMLFDRADVKILFRSNGADLDQYNWFDPETLPAA